VSYGPFLGKKKAHKEASQKKANRAVLERKLATLTPSSVWKEQPPWQEQQPRTNEGGYYKPASGRGKRGPIRPWAEGARIKIDPRAPGQAKYPVNLAALSWPAEKTKDLAFKGERVAGKETRPGSMRAGRWSEKEGTEMECSRSCIGRRRRVPG